MWRLNLSMSRLKYIRTPYCGVCCTYAILFSLLCGAPPICGFPEATGVSVAAGLVAKLWAGNLTTVRSVVHDPVSGSVLALLSGTSQVVALKESDDGQSVTKKVVAESPEDRLTHGLALHDGYLYASSVDVVYRWPYNPARRSVSNAPPQIVVKNLAKIRTRETAKGHNTRTLVFDNSSRLYISVGSVANVDPTSFRARIRRVDLTEPIPDGGHDFLRLEVFADGLRNEVGLAFDSRGRLWGVENGADNLQRADFGQNISQNNPAEEINLFDGPPGTHYGYPWCFSAYNLTNPNNQNDTRYLEQFAWPEDEQFTDPDFKARDDAWCKNTTNNRPPKMGLPAHNAPLGIHFYDAAGCDEEGAFDCWMKGDAFVALHGSWNRDVPDGYKVVRVPFNAEGMPQNMTFDIIWQTDYQNRCTKWPEKFDCFRPVDAIFLPNGKMLVSSDTTGEIIQVSKVVQRQWGK